MTKLLEQAVEAARELSPDEQDEIAQMILGVVDSRLELYELSPADKTAVDAGLAELDRGAFVSEEGARAILAKYRR